MIIGTPKEIKDNEYRVGITPGGVRQLEQSGHKVLVETVRRADLLIGGVLIKGAKAPRLMTREMISTMNQGSVVIDVSVDQGGCIETTKPTTHSNPTYLVDGIIHYCVSNIPGAVPRTSTYALSNATLPYVLKLANMGSEAAIKTVPSLAKGVNTYKGKITYQAIAEVFGLKVYRKRIGQL